MSAIGEPLPAEVLARRAALPRKPAGVVLDGTWVRLRPLEPARDVDALHAVSSGAPIRLGDRACDAFDPDARIWRYMHAGPFADAAALGAVLRAQVEAPKGLPFTVLDRSSGHPLGVANYLANEPDDLKIELGSIWYSPIAQGTGDSTEATYLLLRHAFELGYRRLEWKCDSLNERSRRAALKLGFRFEGVQEAHYIVKGRNRDTAWFRMLSSEWPVARARLETMLASR